MVKKFTYSVLALILFVLICIDARAQSGGKIAGKIIDQKTSETLIGATIAVQGSNKGAAANIDGRYVINDLKPGTYTVIVKYIGYQTKEISDVQVTAGAVTNLDIVMQQAVSQSLNEVVIKATYRQASIASLYAIQKNSVSISDGISAELIKKSPDRSTSDVLKRVSGATIQDNKFVVVRGLSDRYNSASLDGTSLPSTEPNRKAFSFDIVPANLIDNIIISKTATPDVPGDFAGGNIQVLTKDIPDQNFITIGLGYSYNTQSTFKDFKSGYRNVSDYFGFDGGARSLVSNFPTTSQVVGPPRLTATQNLQTIRSLNNDFNIYSQNAFLGQSYQFTLGNVKEIGAKKNRFGTTIALTYRNAETTIPGLIRKFDNYNYTEDQYKFATNIGALANFAYSFGNNKITFKNLYNRIFEDQFTYRTGSNTSSSSYNNRFYAFDLIQKALLKSTLEGDHKVGANAKFNWNLGYSNVLNDQPDQRKINYVQTSANDPFVASITSLGKENARFFSKLNENIYSGKADFKLPVKLFKQTSNLKVGVSSQYRDRTFDARFLGVTLIDATSDIRLRPIQTLFGPNAIASGAFQLDEIPNPNDRYTAHSFTNSAYVMMDNKLSDKIREVYGLRVEKFDLSLSTKDADQKQPRAELNNTDFLPSVNFTYSLTPKANLRASYYRTLARPEFRELAPFAYYDYELLATQIGNPNLKRTLIDNADLRYEFYPSAGQIFSFSVFYKKFYNAIEPSIDDVNSSTTISYFNAKSAYVYGIEMEARKNLDFLGDGGFYKNSTVYANLALTKSQIQNPGNPQLLEQTRPLVGQSPYVINAGFQHTAFDNSLSLNILYNKLGRRIFYAGGERFPSIYENPRDVVDFQIGYKILKKKGEIKLNGSDLFNQKNTFYYDYDKSKTYTPNSTDQTFKRYAAGATYSIVFNYTF
jgi:TonB-dependent receptor